jgi:flagellar biosynthesis protein FlhG
MAEEVQSRKARTVAIASGKGGVGKTIVTANLSLSLAQQFGKRSGPVVAIDLDLGCGNLNACLGVRSPNGTINSFLSKKVPSLHHILTPTPQKHLHMICSSYSGSPEMALTDSSKKELLDEASALEASWVLMDLGAGTSVDVLDLFLGATEKIIVITPEALSLHNAFLFLKTLILHYLWRELGKEGFLSAVKPTWQKMIDDRQDIIIPELIDRIRDWDRYAAYVLTGLINDLKIKFLVNQYRGSSENSHLKNFHHLLFKYLCVRTNISYLGFVNFDEGVRKSVQGIKPFLLDCPENRAAQDLKELAKRLAEDKEMDTTPPLHLPEETESFSSEHPQDSAVNGFIGSAGDPVQQPENGTGTEVTDLAEDLAEEELDATTPLRIHEEVGPLSTDLSSDRATADLIELAKNLDQKLQDSSGADITALAESLRPPDYPDSESEINGMSEEGLSPQNGAGLEVTSLAEDLIQEEKLEEEELDSLASEYPQDLAAQDILELAKHMAESQDSSAEDILALAERLARKEAS